MLSVLAAAAFCGLASPAIAQEVAVVPQLRAQGVIASVAPYPSAFVRLTPSIMDNLEDVEAAQHALRATV